MNAAQSAPLALLLIFAATQSAAAADTCPTNPWLGGDFAPTPGTELSAQRLEGSNDLYRLSGEVRARSGERWLTTEEALYYPLEQRVQAEGNMSYASPGVLLKGQRAELRMGSEEVDIADATYKIRMAPPRHGQHTARGAAIRIRQDDDGLIRLDDAGYTTCPSGDPAWELRASRVELDRVEGIGSARNLTLELGGVPIFYAPWFSFPIGDQRKSGFLFPEIGDSDTTGFSLRTPWYWNIAPQADATLTPRVMSERGVAMETEWRYLNSQGFWQLDADVLQRDDKTGESRSYYRLRHEGRFGARWDTRIDAARVSDVDYFDDFGDDPALSAESHLDRRAELIYRGDRHRITFRAQRYQTVDETIAASGRPYERLPQLLLTGRWPLLTSNDLSFSLRAEAVRFDRDNTVTGDRIDLRPKVDLNLSGASWFARPALTLWHTSYALNDADPGVDAHPTRSLPVFSVDSGLFFERDRDNGGLQTLEPRLFYLRTPFRAQSDIPVFDSGAYDFGLAQLFRDNRFSGADRVADANQLTVALTTRLLDEHSRETFSAGIGQILYFDDRQVQLSGTTADIDSRSPMVGELTARLDANWQASASAEFDDKANTTTQSKLRLGYRGAGNHLFNATHRYSREDVADDPEEQIDLSGAWPLSDRWLGYARWNYSLDEGDTLNSLIGLEYDSCCWSLRIVNRRYRTDDDEINRSIYAQLVLKSLSDFGRDAGAQLERDILGYSDPYD